MSPAAGALLLGHGALIWTHSAILWDISGMWRETLRGRSTNCLESRRVVAGFVGCESVWGNAARELVLARACRIFWAVLQVEFARKAFRVRCFPRSAASVIREAGEKPPRTPDSCQNPAWFSAKPYRTLPLPHPGDRHRTSERANVGYIVPPPRSARGVCFFGWRPLALVQWV